MNRFLINKWVCPDTVMSFSLKASQCVGFSRKLHCWRKCHPEHTSTLHSSQSSYSLCVSYTTYVGKSDHVCQLSQLCQRLWQIKSFCVFTGSAFLQGVHVAQTLFCCDVVPTLENTILLTISGQKKACTFGLMLSLRLLCCGAMCLEENRMKKEIDL